jgi:hypothetical protein
MDLVWLLIGSAVVVIAAAAFVLAPARCTILIDTATSTARVEQRLFWGLGPMTYNRILPASVQGNPIAVFYDVTRIGHALMTPGLAEVTYRAVQRVFALKPKVARFELDLNLADPAQNLVVQTAAQAALAMAPAAIRDIVVFGKCDTPGAEVHAKFELIATPGQINAIYSTLKQSRPGHEFRKRLKRKPKAPRRPVREVRAP